MKILSAEEIRTWDQYTIENEPISSLDLMERAALRCVEWIERQGFAEQPVHIYCGKGNNGGDGLAIARLLGTRKFDVSVFILEFGHLGTPDFQANLARLHKNPSIPVSFIQSDEHFHAFTGKELIIDALFGSGLNRSLGGVTEQLVNHINASTCTVIAIDIPSGMFVEHSSKNNPVVRADHTLTFQCLKPAFLVAENAGLTGDVHILDIGLHPFFYESVSSRFEWLDHGIINSLYKKRPRFSHKGNFGHALLVAGSYGKIGAAILAAKACLRSGAGLLTAHIPRCGYDSFQSAIPESMVMTDENPGIVTRLDTDLAKFNSIGIGPGIGTDSATGTLLRDILQSHRNPVVLDADALNIIGDQRDLLKIIPPGSILTPHPKEFERMFGPAADDFEKIETALQKAKELNLVIILKGHHTLIAAPEGIIKRDSVAFFNSTGNPGMATAGSGDVLTGILTGLLAQGYHPVEAALLGVFLHGLAGDLAAAELSEEAMIAGDIIEQLGNAFRQLRIPGIN
jgi:ADP-dependent NAD(P)H-hydrate dehydratase / NAD(P)H-hydrate epimerase